MLEMLRNATGGIIAKIFIGLLVASFAVWGIADIFVGGQSTALATVGTTEISTFEYQRIFRNELRSLSRRLGRDIDINQARTFGLDRQILNRLVGQAAIDDQVTGMGLKLSNQTIANHIANNPAFKDNSGKFSKAQFEAVLFQNGLSEGSYVESQRVTLLRDQIGSIIDTGVAPPQTLLKTLFNYQAEKREVTFFMVPASAAATVPEPTDSDISGFYDANKSQFKAPEYRKISVLALQPETVAVTIDVTDADVKSAYEDRTAQFERAERREILQIGFPTKAEAEKARTELTTLEDFKALAKKRGLKDTDLALGTVAKTEMLDDKIAAAAFGLAEKKISDAVQGNLTAALLYVVTIQPGGITPFEDVSEKLKKTLALERSQDEILSLHDTIEDELGGGATLSEIATKLSLKAIQIEAIDRSGRDKNGNPIDGLPVSPRLLEAIFTGEVDDDIEAIEAETSGFFWKTVEEITPTAIKPLDEARSDVIIAWKQVELQKNLNTYSATLIERLNAGESFLKVASSIGTKVQQSKELSRFDSDVDISNAAITKIFLTDLDAIDHSTANKSAAQVIFKVSDIITPPFDATTVDAKALSQHISTSLGSGLMSQYETALKAKAGVTINERIWSEISGGANSGSSL